MHKRYFDGAEAIGGYARAVKAGEMIFVSGSTSMTPDGGYEGDTVYEQTRLTYHKVEKALAQFDATMADVVRITAYITDMMQSEGFSRAHAEAFPGEAVPAAALIGCASLLRPELLIEIEVTAILA